MVLRQQTENYNCGVFALSYLLEINGFDVNIKSMERVANEKDGTSHIVIEDFLLSHGIPFKSKYNSTINNIITPCLINYQYCDESGCDGHYAVVTTLTKNNIVLYNPAIGTLEIINKNGFDDIFYSERYGRGWSLWIT